MSVNGNGTLSVLVPQDANIHTLLLGINPSGNTNPMVLKSGSNSFYQFPVSNWTTTVVSIANPQLSSSGSHVDSSGRNWSMIDVEFSLHYLMYLR